MTHTTRHVAFAIGWFILFPFAVMPLFISGGIPSSNAPLVSALWGLGLVACFASWALVDAPAHGASRNIALGFTAAWFLVFVFAVFPYLFATRGKKVGALASLKFLSLCLACLITWLLLPRIFGSTF
jgi:hypothetical protein